VFALGTVDLLGRLRRTGWTHRFRGSLASARRSVTRTDLRRNLAVFLAAGVELSSRKMDTSSYAYRGGFATIRGEGIGSCEPPEATRVPRLSRDHSA
jgi:hypothetical protein